MFHSPSSDLKMSNNICKHISELSFTDLPADILNQVIYWIAHGPKALDEETLCNFQSFTFLLNHIRLGKNNYDDLISLSSTCSMLRIHLAPLLFEALSLVRVNQIDALLFNPRILEQYSDKKKYHRELIKETLESGFRECSKSDLARNSFRVGVNGDSKYKSKYQRLLSINNFVKYLECDNSLLTSSDFGLFMNITALKVLDLGYEDSQITAIREAPNLKQLSINILTLSNLASLSDLLSKLTRLDILIDFNEIRPNRELRIITDALGSCDSNLKSLNLFFNDSGVISYDETLGFIEIASRSCCNLKSFSLRTTRLKGKSSESERKWQLSESSLITDTERLLKALREFPRLECITIEMKILSSLTSLCKPMSLDLSAKRNKLKLQVIDQALSSPRLSDNLKPLMSNTISFLEVSELYLLYGEVIEQSHIQALNLIVDFMDYLSVSHDFTSGYEGIKAISLEKCWSVSDDSIRRDYYHNCIKNYTNSKHSSSEAKSIWEKMSVASPCGVLPFNSPRYRRRETYIVTYTNAEPHPLNTGVPGNRVLHSGLGAQGPGAYHMASVGASSCHSSMDSCIYSHFWDIEASLTELEQYSIQRRPSRLWC